MHSAFRAVKAENKKTKREYKLRLMMGLNESVVISWSK